MQKQKGPPSPRGRTFYLTNPDVDLVASQLESAFRRSGVPCAGNGAVIGTDVFELSISDEVCGLSLVVFAVRFNVDCPFLRIERHDF